METLFIGRNTVFLRQVDSTNSYAIDLLKNVNPAEGTIVHAAHQTNGRGQRGSVWDTEKTSNLTASLIIKPTFLEIKNQYYLYQISALACYDTLAELLDTSLFDIKIKWPNDILINKQKIAGILIENNITNSQINWSIIGVGLNVNQLIFDKKFNATSLRILMNKEFEVHNVLQLFCKHFEKYYLQLKSNKQSNIKDNYLKHFFGLNTQIDFEIEGTVKKLYINGVNEDGLLWLKNESGNSIYADVKQVKWMY